MQETDVRVTDEAKVMKVGDGRINLAEWIAIITDDTTNYDTLSNLINTMVRPFPPSQHRELRIGLVGIIGGGRSRGWFVMYAKSSKGHSLSPRAKL